MDQDTVSLMLGVVLKILKNQRKILLMVTLSIFLNGCVESNHLDYGRKVVPKMAVGDCFKFQGSNNKVLEILNKNYRYKRLSDQKELLYPISAIDKSMVKGSCAPLD